MRILAWTRTRNLRDERGYSLTELLISMAIFGVLMAIVFAVMIQLMQQTAHTVSRTETLQQARLGVAQIDRQVRSGNVILDPGADTTADVPPYFSMRILTDAEATTRCAQWRVIDTDGDMFGDLQFRDWNPDYPAVNEVTDWGVVAHNLVEMDVAPTGPSDITDDPATWPPFWVEDTGVTASDSQAQFVRITLRLKDPQERADAEPTSVTTVVTGRNTVFTHSTDSCSQVPPP
jgi:prepilin-type N-terminal cleavage/methylation domain-containing protein